MKMGLKLKKQTILEELKDELVGKERGMITAFKLSLGEAIHYWRKYYAPRHFKKGADQRYGTTDFLARYASMKPHGSGIVGSEGVKSVQETIRIIGSNYYSDKMARQAKRGLPIDNSPLVFTGLTRSGILHGSFTTRGTSKAVRGSWNDARINWRALSANGGRLGRLIIVAAQSELNSLIGLIRQNWFPHYAGMVRRRERLPSLADLPTLAR